MSLTCTLISLAAKCNLARSDREDTIWRGICPQPRYNGTPRPSCSRKYLWCSNTWREDKYSVPSYSFYQLRAHVRCNRETGLCFMCHCSLLYRCPRKDVRRRAIWPNSAGYVHLVGALLVDEGTGSKWSTNRMGQWARARRDGKINLPRMRMQKTDFWIRPLRILFPSP